MQATVRATLRMDEGFGKEYIVDPTTFTQKY